MLYVKDILKLIIANVCTAIKYSGLVLFPMQFSVKFCYKYELLIQPLLKMISICHQINLSCIRSTYTVQIVKSIVLCIYFNFYFCSVWLLLLLGVKIFFEKKKNEVNEAKARFFTMVCVFNIFFLFLLLHFFTSCSFVRWILHKFPTIYENLKQEIYEKSKITTTITKIKIKIK